MEARRRRAASAEATRRRLYSLLALAGDYLKYLFMKRGRLLGRVARRTLALILSSGAHGGRRHLSSSKHHHLAPKSSSVSTAPWPPCALAEHEFSCSNSPSPAFLAARRLQSRLKRGAISSSCFGALRAPAEEFINMFYEQLRAQSFPPAVFH
ncbi:hypothetical protein E2562_009904 [Oryza meyeriana var. granulata]|uniref:Uncharacterized protein n=1 Tax=Oryza meyeriana var. granulata TaxID=110450 RepID=A0A6G1BV12_9ORYZ|nr:hypothetical protein E2562_009904 [Oryza meyeriana var. granulata]